MMRVFGRHTVVSCVSLTAATLLVRHELGTHQPLLPVALLCRFDAFT